jgi:hypothetical protein
VHERVELPDPPEIFVWLRVHTRPVEFVVTARTTVPANPLTGATVIVELPAEPAFTVRIVGLAVNVKSGAFVT